MPGNRALTDSEPAAAGLWRWNEEHPQVEIIIGNMREWFQAAWPQRYRRGTWTVVITRWTLQGLIAELEQQLGPCG